MEKENLLIMLAGVLFIFWVYKCIIKKEEGRFKNIIWLGGRWCRGSSGEPGKIIDENGNVIDGENHGSWDWHWYGIQSVDRYKFSWSESKPSSEVSSKEVIKWGNLENDSEVTIQRNEKTIYLLSQHDYRFPINNLETGEKKNDPNDPPAKNDAKQPQNAKINSNTNSTIIMKNIRDARFRQGGKADWYSSVMATIAGTLGEIISELTYGELPKIRGEKLHDYPVKNTEPREEDGVLTQGPDGVYGPYIPLFKDSAGKRKETIRFVDRVNYEVMKVKRLGVELSNITLLDYNLDDESEEYMKALRANAVAAVEEQTADHKANALKKIFNVKRFFLKDVVRDAANSIIAIKKQEDVTQTKIAKSQNQLRVKVDGGSGQGSTINVPDLTKIVETTLGVDIAKEIASEVDTEEEPKKKQKDPKNQKDQNKKQQKGGNN